MRVFCFKVTITDLASRCISPDHRGEEFKKKKKAASIRQTPDAAVNYVSNHTDNLVFFVVVVYF